MPTVSVVIPNYNHARFLPKRIESVLRQTYQDFELILLDDCSSDDSRSILSKYAGDPRVRIEFNGVNSGSTFKQWNKGVRLAEGKYVWIAESDDYADERLLETLVARLDAEPAAVLAYCRSWRVSAEDEIDGLLDASLIYVDDPQRWAEDFSADGREECRKYLVRTNTIQNASSALFRKDVYWQVGGADESLVYCADWKVWAAMALTGGTIAHVGEPLNYYRFHETTVTASSGRMGLAASEYLRAIRWILERAAPEKRIRARLGADLLGHWSPAVLNRRIPFSVRKEIFRNAMAIDHYAVLRLISPALTALRFTMVRRLRLLRESVT